MKKNIISEIRENVEGIRKKFDNSIYIIKNSSNLGEKDIIKTQKEHIENLNILVDALLECLEKITD